MPSARTRSRPQERGQHIKADEHPDKGSYRNDCAGRAGKDQGEEGAEHCRGSRCNVDLAEKRKLGHLARWRLRLHAFAGPARNSPAGRQQLPALKRTILGVPHASREPAGKAIVRCQQF